MPAKKKLVRAARQPRKRKPISISPRHSSVQSGGDDEEVQQVLSGETEPPTIPAVVTTGGTTGSTSTATTTTGPTSTATTTTSSTAILLPLLLCPRYVGGSGFISEEDEEKMIEWLQENRFIYDMKSKQYKDKSGKTTAWQEQADTLGFEGKLKFILNCLFFLFILLKR